MKNPPRSSARLVLENPQAGERLELRLKMADYAVCIKRPPHKCYIFHIYKPHIYIHMYKIRYIYLFIYRKKEGQL